MVLAITEPNTETGMTDYLLDQVEWRQHHPAAVDRLTGSRMPAHRLSAKALPSEGAYTLIAQVFCGAFAETSLAAVTRCRAACKGWVLLCCRA